MKALIHDDATKGRVFAELPKVGSRWRMKNLQSYGQERRWALVIGVWVTEQGFGRVRTVGIKRSTMRLRVFLRDYEKVSNPTAQSRREVRMYRGGT